MPTLSVVVCTRDRAASLSRLLKSMRRLVVPDELDWEIVVVDNGSTDRTADVIRRFEGRLPIRTVHEPRPGLARARNAALETTAQHHTIWTDDDVRVGREWLSVYERAFRYWPQFSFFGGPIAARFEGWAPPRWLRAAVAYMPEAFSRLEPTDQFVELGNGGGFFPFGANMAFRAGVFDELRFDERLGRQPGSVLIGGEEIQLMTRVVKDGGTGLWLPPAGVEHWFDAKRQTLRHLYDHAFGDGFVGEMVGRAAHDAVGSALAAKIDESFQQLERELSQRSRRPADWLPTLKTQAEAHGRALACSLIPEHHGYRRRRKNRPLVVVGLDGFEVSLADRWIAEGALPHLAALRKRSARYALEHGDALYSGLAWEQFSVGRSPDAYGRHSAVDFDVETYRTNQRGTASATFLQGVDAHAVVFDLPYFDLARTRCASGMTNWGAHDPGTLRESTPSSLAGEIHRKFGDYPAADWIYGFVWPDPDAASEMASRLEESARLRGQICRWLLTERFPEWDLALLTAGEMHSAVEALWHGIDAAHPLHGVASSAAAARGLRAVYEATDGMLGELRAALPDADLLVFSMHGMRANVSDPASMLLLPELLYRHAFHTPAFTPDPSWKVEAGLPMLAAGQDWSAAVNARISLPASLTARASGEGTEGNLHWMPAERYRPAWPQMDAFALPSLYDGRVRINLAGRERHGRVSLAGYEACCQRIRDLLMECRDPRTGERIVDHIQFSAHANPLDVDPSDCDLKVRWSHATLGLEHPELGTIGPVPYRRTGGHRGHGVAWIDAEGIAAGDYGVAGSFDIIPTVLSMLGETPPGDVSGRSLHPGSEEPD